MGEKSRPLPRKRRKTRELIKVRDKKKSQAAFAPGGGPRASAGEKGGLYSLDHSGKEKHEMGEAGKKRRRGPTMLQGRGRKKKNLFQRKKGKPPSLSTVEMEERDGGGDSASLYR